MSGSKLNLAVKCWMRRSDEFALTAVSKAFWQFIEIYDLYLAEGDYVH